MSMSLGRALRACLAAACALVALAVGAGPAMAELLSPETTEAPARLSVLNGTYESSDNTWTVPAGGDLDVTVTISGSNYGPGAVFPEILEASFCEHPEFAGAYVIVGSILSLPWRPSRGGRAASRRSGPSNWANETTTATVPDPECEGGGTLAEDQILLDSGTRRFLVALALHFCQDGDGDYVLTGTSVGMDGRRTTYLVPSLDATWSIFTLGALGAVNANVEQVTNLNVTNLPDPSEPCPTL